MPFLKPENALKRAEEFIDVGKKQRALDTLFEVIRSKKHRTWSKIHEPIMKNYLNLCVELKESHMAKDGLHQYKTITQSVNVKSLEDVITGYLALAEEKAEKAKRDASDANVVVDVDDLENLNSPESILLKAVSGESSQDRADRDLLAPWLKFVWESYKQCLELLKNNNKLESLYQQVAKQAFTFCAKYQRKTEFRKLCETIRQHMIQSQKYTGAAALDFNKPETQNYHLEIRLFQLNHAISMELWQEAYKAVEDIYTLMNLSRTKPKPSQMFNYYNKLSLIFWKAGNHLFHAATLQKLYVLLKEQKKTITAEELTKISTKLLLSTLAIPIPPNRSPIDECLDQDETTQEKIKRLTSLLNLPQPPTRLSLIKDLNKYNVMQHVYPELRDLYKWLEVEFHPLKLSERATKCLDFIETRPELAADYLQYVPPIKEIAVTRLIKQISQVYTTIEIARFVKLAPAGIDIFQLEKLIVDGTKQLDLQVRVNHQTQSLHFGNDLYVAQKEDMPEGPTIQSMPSEQIRNQLISMSDALQQAQQLIYGAENKGAREELAQTIAHVYRQTCDKHHADLLRRRQAIEEQKEMYEAIHNERLEREAEEKKQKEKLLASAAVKGQVRDAAFYADAARAAQDDEKGPVAGQDEETRKQIEQLNKEKKELAERLKKEEKKYDHFVRACHEVEIPLIGKVAEEDSQIRKKFWEKKELERIENLKREQQVQAENRDRLMRMLDDKVKFEQIIHSARKEEYERKKVEFQAKLKTARENKLAERKEKRKLDRRTAHFKEIEDKKRREDEERRRVEDDERRRKQDEQAAKQREREREIEEKMARDRLNVRKAQEREQEQQQQTQQQQQAPASQAYRPRAAGGAGFAAKPAAESSGADNDNSWRRPAEPEREERDDRRRPYRGPGGGGEDEMKQRGGMGGAGGGERKPPQSEEQPWRRGAADSDNKENDSRYPPRRGIMDDDNRRGPRDMGSREGGPSGGFNRGGGDRGDRGGDRGSGMSRGGGMGGDRGGMGGDRGGMGGERRPAPRGGFDSSRADNSDNWRRGGQKDEGEERKEGGNDGWTQAGGRGPKK